MNGLLTASFVALIIAITPVSASAKGDTPCFSGPPLIASTVYGHLHTFADSMAMRDETRPLPSGTYGRCTIKKGTLLDRRGNRVARLHCGIEVERRGLLDHLGLQVGVLGKQVIERSRHKQAHLVCTGYTGGSRCVFQMEIQEEPNAVYKVKGRLADNKVLRGAEAVRFFARQRVRSFMINNHCH